MAYSWQKSKMDASEIASTTKRDSPYIYNLICESLSTLMDWLLESEREVSKLTDAEMGLTCHIINTLSCSFDLAVRGFYSQSLGLMRLVHENWVSIHYINKFPEKADMWLERNKKTPSHSEMLKAFPDLEPERVREWYQFFSKFVHSNSQIIQVHLCQDEKENYAIIGPSYNQVRFRVCTYSIALFSGIMLHEVFHYHHISDSFRVHNYKNITEQISNYIDRENSLISGEMGMEFRGRSTK